jgi:putative addiction module component (TIGR02574 family)
MILETIPQLASLSREQKALLAYELWDAAESEDQPLTPEQITRIEEGLTAYKANPDAVFTTEQVTERIRRLKESIQKSRG